MMQLICGIVSLFFKEQLLGFAYVYIWKMDVSISSAEFIFLKAKPQVKYLNYAQWRS